MGVPELPVEDALALDSSDEGKPLVLDATTAQAAAILRRIHLHILPIFLAMAALCYLDRTNTAFASLQMNRTLGFSSSTYGLGSGLFFVGYSLSMIPSQLLLMRCGAPRHLAFIVTAWGLVAMGFAFMTSRIQFFFLRMLLGCAESGAFPAMWFYMNGFYPADAITLPYSLIEAAVGVANVLGAPIAAALLSLDGFGGLQGWQWLYLLEGLPSVMLGVTMAWALPRDVQSARFLSPPHKAWLVRAQAANRKHAEAAESQSYSALLWEAARNPRIWLVSGVAFLKNSAMVAVLFWTTPIVNALLTGDAIDAAAAAAAAAAAPAAGHGRLLLLAPAGGTSAATHRREVHAVLLTAIPFASAAVCAIWLGHRSQQRGEKCRHIALPYALAAVLFVLFPIISSAGGSVAAFVTLTAAVASLTAPNAVLNALASSVGQGPASALSLALYNSVGNLGGLVGPTAVGWVVQETGLYSLALQLLGVLVAVGSATVWSMRRWQTA